MCVCVLGVCVCGVLGPVRTTRKARRATIPKPGKQVKKKAGRPKKKVKTAQARAASYADAYDVLARSNAGTVQDEDSNTFWWSS